MERGKADADADAGLADERSVERKSGGGRNR
jgi:hypothetical protein